MLLWIVAVGQRMPDWVQAGFDEYVRRMPPDMRIELREVKAEPRTSGRPPDALRRAEGQRIDATMPKGALLVALDERGVDATTRQLSQRMQGWRAGGRDIVFAIGGPDGLDPSIVERADLVLRLSSLTLPHALVRVVLAEALYRAWTVEAGHPYHRAG